MSKVVISLTSVGLVKTPILIMLFLVISVKPCEGQHTSRTCVIDDMGDKGAKGNYQPINIPGMVCSFQA